MLKPVVPFQVTVRSSRERTFIVDARTPEEAEASVDFESPETDDETVEEVEAFPLEDSDEG